MLRSAVAEHIAPAPNIVVGRRLATSPEPSNVWNAAIGCLGAVSAWAEADRSPHPDGGRPLSVRSDPSLHHGNGRTGRILNLLYLVEQQLLDLPVLYLSHAIIRDKAA